ncbi:MAG: type II toxin-antitoxin system RelE/ParE family toxin [Oscillospiraceae bacterium]|nr:type II toxin-antitoxin system RelE/ParE family toxin [Oscillospiraceae bacterium]
MQEFEIKFYDKPDGTKPVAEFIKKLDPKMKSKVIWTIDALESCGNGLREPYSKHLDDGIFELRAKVSTDISRTLYFFIVGKRVVLTHGFIKKTKKTPPEEIELAKKYRNEYLNRKGNQQ